MSRDEVIQRLLACAEDPMWADHAEVSKSTLRAAVALLTGVCPACKGTGTGGSWQSGQRDGGQSATFVEHECEGCDGAGSAGQVGSSVYRFLTSEDTIQRGDEFVSDDYKGWEPVSGVMLGMRYSSGMKTMRRAYGAVGIVSCPANQANAAMKKARRADLIARLPEAEDERD